MPTSTTTDSGGGSGTGGGYVPDVVLGGSGFSVSPGSQTTVTGVWSGWFTIALTSGVAPAGGYVFGLGAVNSFGLSAGLFDPGATVTMAAGASTCQFRYQPLYAGVDTISIYPPSGLGSGGGGGTGGGSGAPVSVSVSGVSVSYPAFGVSPASQGAVTGSASGAITVALLGGAVAPAGGLTFGLSASVGGVTISTGGSVTIASGSSTGSFNVTSGVAGTVRVTVTPPSVGVSGSAQSVTVTFAGVASGGPTSGSSSPLVEVDVRCYNADGTRKAIPDLDSLSWEVGEQGGMQTGTLQFLVPWEGTSWTGGEWIDVRLWGGSQVVYRGWVRHPQQELGTPERSSPTLHGLFELLNGYEVRRDFGYAPAVSPTQFFSDLVALYVTRAGRWPSLVIDTAGVDALGLRMWGLQVNGQSVPQALNSLCGLFPNQLIWGCDVDPLGNNRIYLRPRATAVKYRAVVGREVTAFVYPRDCTRIVNRIFVTGGKYDGSNGTNVSYISYVNLLTNASFEEGAPNNEIDGNVLVNGGFETNTAFATSSNPWVTGGAAIDTSTAHGGSNSCELNNDDIAQEYVYQDFGVAGSPSGVHASCWWCGRSGMSWSPQIRLELWNGSVMVASSYSAFSAVTDTAGYTFMHFQLDWYPPSVTCTKVRVTYILTSETSTGYAGQTLVDDCSLWFDGPELAKGWRVTGGSGGSWSAIDWRNRDFTPFDGDVMVRAVAAVTGGAGSYAEMATNTASRPVGQPTRGYYLQFMVFNPGSSAVHAAAVARVIKNGVIQATPVGASVAVPAGAWTAVGMSITTGSNCDSIEVGLRVYDSGTYYIDAAGMWADLAYAPPWYVAGDTFAGVRDTSDYSLAVIGTAAAASMATWGEREASVTNADVLDPAALDAFAISYFKEMAVPQIQATLRVQGVTPDVAILALDGQVQVVNLPMEPGALTPVRLRYQAGKSLDMMVDLNNERPQLENLLRLVVAGKA